MKIRVHFLLLLVVSLRLGAQEPYLVRDINTSYLDEPRSSHPTEFVSALGRTFFVAKPPTAGAELWMSDGTGAGTSMVADIAPGPASSNPISLHALGNLLTFNASTAEHGAELWATDGTAAGTRRVLDINPGPASSSPGARIVFGSRLLFSADDGMNGRELWITDGNAAGTRMLKDLNPGATGSSPAYFVTFGGSVYFSAQGLWKTDGTEAGTVKIATGTMRNLAAVGSQLFFEAFTFETGWEPWVSDGTEAGTRSIVEIAPGTQGGLTTNYSAVGFTPFEGRVLFGANDGVHGRELWISDGTAAGTRMVRDFTPGPAGTYDQKYAYVIPFGDRAFVNGSDAEHGDELWITDGTPAGTALFADLHPGAGDSNATPLYATGGRLFFHAAPASPDPSRLWVTDGTAAGTRIVNAADGEDFVLYASMRGAGNQLWFSAQTPLHGIEPWVSDGTDAGTRRVANIALDDAPSSRPRMFAATKELLFFYATESPVAPLPARAESSLWRTDGTAAGTFKLRETGQHPAELTAAGSLVFFNEPGNGGTRHMSDGTVAGTRTAVPFLQRFGGLEIRHLFPVGDTLFASVESPFSGSTLWKTSDAPNAPAVRLGGVNPDAPIEVAGRHVFFASADAAFGARGLWTTDGTAAGTYAIKPDLDPEAVGELGHAGGTIYFLMQRRDEKTKLWKSDGTLDGTVPVKELPAGTPNRSAIAGAGRKVFFALDDVINDELWVSDGTEEGTVALGPVELSLFGELQDLYPAGDRIVFSRRVADDYQVWGSDGTPAGTRMLMNLGPYMRAPLQSIDGIVYMAGADAAHGIEVWTTDGTPEGTRLLADLNPGPASSTPSEFAGVGDVVYVSATSDAVGAELWALPQTQPVLSVADARARESAASARFEVVLRPASQEAVTIDYATLDGTARAGEDYQSVSGTLAFAPGETRKSIEVPLIGDAAVEGNERFFVALRNAHGGRLARSEAAGIIETDDEASDLSVVPVLGADQSGPGVGLRVANHGPTGASDVRVKITTTPHYNRQACTPACILPQIASGAEVSTFYGDPDPTAQTYFSATTSARQGDPNPANNTTSWTVNDRGTMVMDAAYLTPGATATVGARSLANAETPATSSDPSVVTIGAVTQSGDHMSFPVTALRPGSAIIHIGGVLSQSLLVLVAPAGATPRWPGGVTFTPTYFTHTRIDSPVPVTIAAAGEAPFTGATPTGTVVVTSAGVELARTAIVGKGPISLPVYLRGLGDRTYEIAYSGDANFLPSSVTRTIVVSPGNVSITGGLAPVSRAAGTYLLTVEVAGSPLDPPTGVISVVDGTRELARVTLQPQADGVSRFEVTLTGLPPADPKIFINYLGDALYGAASQQLRVITPKRRSTRH